MTMIRTAAILGCALLVPKLLANPNACDDYIARHYKKDLKLMRLFYQNRTHMGDIRFPHQRVSLQVKNIGQVDFTGSTPYRRMTLKIKGIQTVAQIKMPLKSGESTTVVTTLRPKTLKHCQKTSVVLDVRHDIGQWGCQVWNNDKSIVTAFQFRRSCRVPILP